MLNNKNYAIMKKIKKLYIVNVYNNILEHGFGWYQTGVKVYATSVKDCISQINKLFHLKAAYC